MGNFYSYMFVDGFVFGCIPNCNLVVYLLKCRHFGGTTLQAVRYFAYWPFKILSVSCLVCKSRAGIFFCCCLDGHIDGCSDVHLMLLQLLLCFFFQVLLVIV